MVLAAIRQWHCLGRAEAVQHGCTGHIAQHECTLAGVGVSRLSAHACTCLRGLELGLHLDVPVYEALRLGMHRLHSCTNLHSA